MPESAHEHIDRPPTSRETEPPAALQIGAPGDAEPGSNGALEAKGASDERLAQILEGASRGDQDAWRELAGLYGRRVFALARSRLRNDEMAEDITQSVFMTVAAKLRDGSYAERGRFEAWLFRIVMNRVRDEVRKLSNRPSTADPELIDQRAWTGTGSAAVHASGQDLGLLRTAVAQLGEADREIIELRHQAGLSFATISELVGEPLGTLLARHHRALRKLKDQLSGMGMGPEGATRQSPQHRDGDKR